MVEVLFLLLVLGIFLAHVRACRAGRPAWAGWLALGCRSVALAGLVVLFWFAFRGDERNEDRKDREEREVVILEDHSLSMDLPGAAGGLSRSRLRDQVVDLVEREAARRSSIKVERFCFGGNVLPLAQADRVDRERTRLVPAVEALAARVGRGGVLVLTDGCSSAGEVSGFGKVLAEERGVRFYSIACIEANQEWRELGLGPIQVDELNPERASAEVHIDGMPPGYGVDVRWRVDGADHATSRLNRGGMAVCPLTEVSPGWHELEASVPVQTGEVCTENNTRRAVFRVTGDRHVAFLYGRVDREQMELARLLRRRLGNRLILLSEEEASTRSLEPERLALLIVGRVRPDRAEGCVQACLGSGTTRILYLGTEWVAEWRGMDRLESGPVVPRVLTTPLVLNAPSGLRSLAAINEAKLPVRRYLLATPRPGTQVLGTVGGGLPVLLADHPQQPTMALLLLDDTWRWLLGHDAATRTGYETFWRTVLDWLVQEERTELELSAELAAPPANTVRFLVRPIASVRAELPKSLTIRIDLPTGKQREVSARYTEEAQGFVVETDYDCPGLVEWAQAEVRLVNRTLASERVPVFRELAVAEYERPIPDLAVCQSIATTAEDAGTYGNADRIVQTMLDSLPQDPQFSRRERSFRREALAAGLMALALALEWLLERLVLRRKT